jgi:hypothetical protein
VKKLGAVIASIFISACIFAGTGTDTLNFLKIKPSARGASIGDGFVAIADDANAPFYNPAGLTQVTDLEFSLMHMLYMADTSYEYASFAVPAGENLKLGAYVIYLNYGSIDRTTENSSGIFQAVTGTYVPSDLAVALSAGYKLSDDLSVGLNLKYALESVDTLSITGLMADAGILTDIEGVRVGAAIYNIGTVSMDKAPAGVRLGGSTKFTGMTENDVTAAVGINYMLASSKISGSLGGEWNYEDFLILRGSYTLMADADSLNLGLGLKQDLDGVTGEVAYNFSLLGDLGCAHRISLGIKFGDADAGGGKKKKKTAGSSANQRPKSTLKYYFKKK